MAKEKVTKPCEYFDMESDSPKETASCYCAPACDFWIENGTQEQIDIDPHYPCKRRYIVDEDTTVDMFAEGDE